MGTQLDSHPTDKGLSPLQLAIRSHDTFAVATAYRDLGVSTFPVKTDGSKEPAFAGWREYAERLPTLDELKRWHSRPNRHGIGVAGGVASGNLAVFDFETWAAFIHWGGSLAAVDREHLARCPVIGTPGGGAHVYVRLVEPMKGCKLARTVAGETLIEIRGCQHYVVAPGSPPVCHPLRRSYRLLRPGWLDGEPFEPMPLDVWHGLTVLAAELNEYSRPAAREVVGDRPASAATGDRPGDDFNQRIQWGDILTPHGWKVYRSTAGATYWCRPGKSPAGVSASTGFCRGLSGRDLLYVFSTSAAPFDAETCYSRFAAYALLNHHGDFKAATRALGVAGYGRPLPRIRFSGKAVCQ
ncbi:MAG: bifunctional DNA primase/polymerase [Planctomycetia bacterium]|nr:bifunctional DNA primase/polymerase [Planctomycetia bacterium]